MPAQHAMDRPERCTIGYLVELGLRRGCWWEGIIPTKLDNLIGWFGAMPHHKDQLQQALKKLPSPERMVEEAVTQSTVIADWQRQVQQAKQSSNASLDDLVVKANAQIEAELARIEATIGKEARLEYDTAAGQLLAEHKAKLGIKAQHLLDETTHGFSHQGQDSPLPNDTRFKRTRKGNLYIGAGNILGVIKDTAWFESGNAGIKRYLDGRLYIRPGKVVAYRYGEGSDRIPIKVADGRAVRTVPPEAPSPSNMFRGKDPSLIFSEKIEYPAWLLFTIFADPDVDRQELRRWLRKGGEYGLTKNRFANLGQYNMIRFRYATQTELERHYEHERQQREAALLKTGDSPPQSGSGEDDQAEQWLAMV